MTEPVNFEQVDQMKSEFKQRRNNILANKQSRGYEVQKKAFNEDLKTIKGRFLIGTAILGFFGVIFALTLILIFKNVYRNPIEFFNMLKDESRNSKIVYFIILLSVSLGYWGLAITGYAHSQFEDIMVI